MIKTLIAADRSERERFRIPRSVQQSIPIQKIYRDGIWQTGGKFSRTWRFADINYALASHEDQRDMFTAYCGALNSLPTDATTKITINNRRLNGADFRRSNFTASIPYELEQLRTETKEFLDDLSTRDQRMIFANVTIVHMADTLEQLNTDTETLQAIGLEQACQFSVLRYQQEDGLNTALPYGLRRIKTTRTLTTESTAVLMPFRVQEIQDAGGIYYGVNAVSNVY